MAWFKEIINNIVKKKASREQALNDALNQLQLGTPSFQVASNFIREMGPDFANTPEANQVMGAMGSPDNLTLILTNLRSAPQQIEQPVEQAPVQPGIEQPIEQVPEVAPEVSTNPEDARPGGSATRIIGQEEVLTQQLDTPPNFEDRVVSDPTLLETFELPVNQIKTARNKLATINKKLRDMYYPEIKIEFVGNAYNKPVIYQNRTVQEPYIQVKISGTLPSPNEEISIKKQEQQRQKDGTMIMKTVGTEPKGVRLIAKIIHKELDEITQNKYLQTLEPDSPLTSDLPLFSVLFVELLSIRVSRVGLMFRLDSV